MKTKCNGGVVVVRFCSYFWVSCTAVFRFCMLRWTRATGATAGSHVQKLLGLNCKLEQHEESYECYDLSVEFTVVEFMS